MTAMQQYLDFALHHWELCLAFILILGLLIGLELRLRLSGLAQVTPQEATLLINREDAVILDIRDQASFEKGHILNAVNIPAHDIEQRIKQLDKYRDKPIIIVHNTSQPPGKTGVILQNNGFLIVKNLTGGINAWQNANLPLVKK